MRIAAVQMVSAPSVETNLEAACRLVASAAAAGAALVVLPEYFCFMGRSDRDKLAIAETPGEGPIQRMLAEAARAHEVWLIGGTLPLAVGASRDRVLNANLVFSPRGELAARYDKMHLFAFDNGRERYDEARTLEAGRAPVAFDAGGSRGLSVCYDLRFPSHRARRGLLATCCRFRPRSPTRPGSRTGRCCCARGRSRTSATSSRPRKAGRTRTGGARSATA
jgi:nitrilase